MAWFPNSTDGGPFALFVLAAILASPIAMAMIMRINDALRADHPDGSPSLRSSIAYLSATIGMLALVYLGVR